jgi:hypothetical protein
MKTAYTYTLLRYIHDVPSGEFANVGVVLLAPEQRFAGARCRDTHGRISKLFPDMDREGFKSLMKYIELQIDALGTRLRTEFALDPMPADAGALARSVLPPDDSSLQWGPVGGGLSEDLDKTLRDLFARYVMRYDEKNGLQSRSDDDVWAQFKKALDGKQLTPQLKPKKISVADDEVEFARAYKNEKWHCIEALSLDLALAESIKDKAHRWLGQMTSVKDSDEPFRVYFLVGAPKIPELRNSYDNALRILDKVPVEHEIVTEGDAAAFANRLEEIVKAHEAT